MASFNGPRRESIYWQVKAVLLQVFAVAVQSTHAPPLIPQ